MNSTTRSSLRSGGNALYSLSMKSSSTGYLSGFCVIGQIRKLLGSSLKSALPDSFMYGITGNILQDNGRSSLGHFPLQTRSLTTYPSESTMPVSLSVHQSLSVYRCSSPGITAFRRFRYRRSIFHCTACRSRFAAVWHCQTFS